LLQLRLRELFSSTLNNFSLFLSSSEDGDLA